MCKVAAAKFPVHMLVLEYGLGGVFCCFGAALIGIVCQVNI